MNAPEPLGRRILVNTGALTGANLWRILVSFLIQLLVARRLGLESLGHYTVAMAFLNVSQVLCELGLPLWMVRELAQRPQARRAYFRAALALQGSMALVLWGGLALAALGLPYAPELRDAIWWVGASLPLFAVSAAAGMLFQAGERLEFLLWVEGVTNTTILAVSAAVILRAGSVADLLIVVVGAQALSAVISLWLVARSRLLAASHAGECLAWQDIRRGASAFFGLSLADVLLQRLDILLLSLLADARLVGLYSAAYNLVRVVVKLVQSYWRGLYPTLNRLHRQAAAKSQALGHDGLRYVLLLCGGGAVVTTVSASALIHIIYGADDPAAATVLAWLIWVAPLFCLELYATTRLLILGRARTALAVSLLHVLLLGGLILPLAAGYGALGAAWATLLAQAGGMAAGLWWLGERIDTATRRRLALGVMLTALATVAGAWLPGPVWVGAGVAALLFLGVAWQMRWLRAADIARLARALRGFTE